MVLAEPGLTLEQFLRLPEREPPLEYEDGEVTQKVSPKLKHSRLQYRLAWAFGQAVGPGEPVWILPELRVTFAGRSVVPDLCLFRRERILFDDEGEPLEDVFQAPDVAVEILSPKQSVMRLIRRCAWYVENGVRVGLLVDRSDRSVLLFRPGVPMLVLRGDDPIDLDDVVSGFKLPVSELFGALKLR